MFIRSSTNTHDKRIDLNKKKIKKIVAVGGLPSMLQTTDNYSSSGRY